MSRILCTFPGKFGDLLWALPTVRAISEVWTPVDLLIPERFRSIKPLLSGQPYLDRVIVDPAWVVYDTAPMTPRVPQPLADPYEAVTHLGYEDWPDRPLAEYVYACEQRHTSPIGPLDLDRPWIQPVHTVSQPAPAPRVIVGWSDEHFELKMGILLLLAARFKDQEFWWLRQWGGRADEIDTQWTFRDSFQPMGVFGPKVGVIRTDWVAAAALMATGTVFLGCLSALWVLANALGLPTVICEPAPARHHPIFWRESPKNHLVLGGDGKPTWDSRHIGDTLQEVLNATAVTGA